MKSKNRFPVVLLAISLIAFIAGISWSLRSNSAEEQVGTIEADYPVYSSTANLAAASDLVVLARVEEVKPSRLKQPPESDLLELPLEERSQFGHLVTDVRFTVVSQLQDSSKGTRESVVGESMLVTELGGEIRNNSQIERSSYSASQPRSKTGGLYLLFLHQMNDGSFDVVGGQQGRFEVTEGMISSPSLVKADLSLPSIKELNGRSILAITELTGLTLDQN